MKPVVLPGPIGPGACIGVVAPAGPAKPELVARVQPWLEAQGWRTRLYPGCHESDGYLAGSDARRVEDLHAAFADPAIDAVVCLRGGYGSARLLDQLDLDLIARYAKPFVGFSDITALHIAFTQLCGFAVWHAPMLASNLVHDDADELRAPWCAALAEAWPAGRTLPHGDVGLRCVLPGVTQGPLVGGNLATLVSLLGTPWAVDTRGAIVFIEEVGEEPYRVDRMLTQLRLAGALQAAAGFVVGSFSDCEDPAALVDSFLRPLGKPVLAGWPAGHCSPHWPLPIGAAVTLDATAGRLTLA